MAIAEGFQTVTIGSTPLQATFVPDAGMVCCSLRHGGVELLAQRGGLRAYAEHGSTMGIPLLYPWANRLDGLSYPGPDGPVQLRDSPLVKLDGNGLPIHGAIPGSLPWELLDAGADQLRARLPWRGADLLAIFPYRHSVELHAHVEDAQLTIATSVHADGGCDVPISFGYHPYLSLPEGERGAWQVELPVSERLLLDQRMIPTGAREPFTHRCFALADGDWDDAFAGLTRPPLFTMAGGGRRIELEFLAGYSHAQFYAPRGERFVCFEPMSAPTNALLSGAQLPVTPAGGAFEAAFRISAGPA